MEVLTEEQRLITRDDHVEHPVAVLGAIARQEEIGRRGAERLIEIASAAPRRDLALGELWFLAGAMGVALEDVEAQAAARPNLLGGGEYLGVVARRAQRDG